MQRSQKWLQVRRPAQELCYNCVLIPSASRLEHDLAETFPTVQIGMSARKARLVKVLCNDIRAEKTTISPERWLASKAETYTR